MHDILTKQLTAYLLHEIRQFLIMQSIEVIHVKLCSKFNR